ncbi:MAG: hypothetical protein ABSB18_03020 [Candidatus Omnitrophota bacterium]
MHKTKNIILCLASLLFFLPAIALADSRDLIVSMTLTRLESQRAVVPSQMQPSYNPALRDVKMNQALAQRAPEKEIPPPAKTKPKEKAMRPPPTDTGIQRTGFYVSGGYNLSHLHYKEFDTDGSGDILDRDYGTLHGYYVNAGYRSPDYYEWALGRPFVELYYRRAADMITYDGQTQSGIPVKFDEELARIHRYGIKLGASQDLNGKHGELFGYLDAGRRIWVRGQNKIITTDIGDKQDSQEIYHWIYFGGGAGVNYEFIPKLSTGIDVELMYAYSPKMKETLDGFKFKLHNVWGVEVKLPIKYYILQNISLDFTPYFTFWWIKMSDIIPIGGGLGVVEPTSHTYMNGLLAGLTWYFN